jgi:hypothetical protein
MNIREDNIKTVFQKIGFEGICNLPWKIKET